MSQSHLYPSFNAAQRRAFQEARLGQKGHLFWFFGLSGSGKSTLAQALGQHLESSGKFCIFLDGDDLRSGLNGNLGFSDEDRKENLRRAAEVSKLFLTNGCIVLASFITPLRVFRDQVRDIIPAEDLSIIYVEASFDTCRKRDVKGLYAKAEAGDIPHFTGKDSGFEPPHDEEVLRIDTEALDPEGSIRFLQKRLALDSLLAFTPSV